MQPAVVTVSLLDGSEPSTYRVASDASVGLIRRRATAQYGAQKLTLCCDGVVLDDTTLVCDLPVHRQLTGWTPRHTATTAAPTAAARVVVHFDRKQAWRYAQAAARVSAKLLSMFSFGTWLRIIIWLVLLSTAGHVGLGGPFLIASALYFVWCVGFSDGENQGVSAYTVFNRDYAALPGQLFAEELQRNMTGGV